MEKTFSPTAIKGLVALITGGGTGLGFGMAQTLGLHGARVVISSRKEKVLQAAIEKLRSQGIDANYSVCDIRDYAACEKTVAKAVELYGQLDIVINNAAGNFLCPAEDLSPNAFKTVLDIDLGGTFNMSRASFPHLSKSTNASILNISATLHHRAFPFQLHCSAAKSGIDTLTRTLAVEWGMNGIRVNSIAPGPIEGTAGGPTGAVFGQGLGDKAGDSSKSSIPVGRFGTPDDIGFTALFLVSPAAKFITGQILFVDGGWSFGTYEMFYQQKDTVRAINNQLKQRNKAAKL